MLFYRVTKCHTVNRLRDWIIEHRMYYTITVPGANLANDKLIIFILPRK